MPTAADPTEIRSGQLPPIGEITPQNEAQAVEAIYNRRLGIINSLKQPIKLARMCRKVATWGENVPDESTPDECTVIVHKIRQAIETQAGNHLNEPPKVTIEPVETGEYAKWYWCGSPEAAKDAVQLGIPLDPLYLGNVGPGGEVYPPLPLPVQLVKLIKDYAQAAPDLIDPTYICKLDDEFTAKTLQKQFDADWRQAQGEKWLRHTVYGNIIEGWKLPLYEFDPADPRKHLLRRNSIEQTYIAQDCEDIDDAAEAGVDLYIDLDEALAKAKDPAHRDAIVQDVTYTMGSPGEQGQVPVAYRGLFYRPMVRKIVWWLRNQIQNVPMGEQEAVDGGQVQQAIPPRPGSLPPPTDAGEGIQSAEGGLRVSDGNDAGAGATIDQAAQPPSYVLPDGTPVDPTHPLWPTTPQTVTARITIIAGRVIEWIVNPLPDIPIMHFRNTIVIGRPWGVGEPFYAKKLQDVYSKITDDATDHVHYNAHPAREMHQGLYQSMQKEFGQAHIHADDIIPVESQYWNPATPFIRTVEPPPFPDSSLKIREMIGEDFNDLYRQDVLAGQSPTPNASGKMVTALQSAAVGPLNFKAGDISYALEKTAKLMLFSILNLTDPQEISDTTSVPMPLLSLVLERARKRSPNVKVTISTGAGAVIQRKRQEMLSYNQQMDPATKMPLASARTTQEALGLDPGVEDRRNLEAVRQTATVLAPLQQQANPDQQQGGGNGDGKQNGNGEHSSNGNGRM